MNFTSHDSAPADPTDAALRRLAQERAPILQQISEGVIIAATDGKLVFVNQAAERLHGVKTLDVAPDHYSDTYHLFTMDGEVYPFSELPLARAVDKGRNRRGCALADPPPRRQRNRRDRVGPPADRRRAADRRDPQPAR